MTRLRFFALQGLNPVDHVTITRVVNGINTLVGEADGLGVFNTSLPVGTILTASRVGHEPLSFTVDVPEGEQIIYLAESGAMTLPEFTAVGRKPLPWWLWALLGLVALRSLRR